MFVKVALLLLWCDESFQLSLQGCGGTREGGVYVWREDRRR